MSIAIIDFLLDDVQPECCRLQGQISMPVCPFESSVHKVLRRFSHHWLCWMAFTFHTHQAINECSNRTVRSNIWKLEIRNGNYYKLKFFENYIVFCYIFITIIQQDVKWLRKIKIVYSTDFHFMWSDDVGSSADTSSCVTIEDGIREINGLFIRLRCWWWRRNWTHVLQLKVF